MNRRPYPDRKRALHQLWRHRQNGPAAADVVVTLAIGTGPFVSAVQQAQASLVFAWHPDLQAMDGVLDNLYPEMDR
jgi:predicted RNA methylase